MSFSPTAPLFPNADTPTVSDKAIFDIETKLNYIFRDKSHLLHALGAQKPSFWWSGHIWSYQAMLRSNNLDMSTESLLRAARYLNCAHILACQKGGEVCDDNLCETVKSILIAVYMDCKDQRMVHHAANYLGLWKPRPVVRQGPGKKYTFLDECSSRWSCHDYQSAI